MSRLALFASVSGIVLLAQSALAQQNPPEQLRGDGTPYVATTVSPAAYGPWTNPNPGPSSSYCPSGTYQIGVDVIGSAASTKYCIGCVSQLRAVCQKLP